MASDRVIEEIKQRLDLVAYVSRTVDLKRAGRTYKARCPFHVENTPSFVVFPHTNTWHCFGACGEGGDLFSYVQKREGLSFSEALQQLAREAGVELEEESEAHRAARSERERLLAICEAAAEQFRQWLRELPAAQPCRDYVARRGLRDETVHRFGLGYAPDSWDALLAALTERGYHAPDLALVGLARERDSGGYYDALRDRLIFPIRDVRGRVIGFGGRALHDEQVPKYLNSPQTPLFDKGRTLYALDLAKDAIRTADRALIVEGYLDAITAHQAGFPHVVASLGTALTSEQIRLLRRFSPNLTLALDADTAGQKAAERGLEAVRDLQRELRRARWERAKRGRGQATEVAGDVRVLALPDGYDPDDLIRESPERWERLVAGALPVVDFLIGHRLRNVDVEDPVQKANVAADLLPVLAEIDATLVRQHYVQRLARLLHSDERTLEQELAQVMQRPAKQGASPPLPMDEPPPPDDWSVLPDDEAWGDEALAPPVADERVRDLEAYLLFLCLERPDFVAQAREYGLRADMWQRTAHRQIWEALEQHAPPSAAHQEEFIATLDAPIAQHVRRILGFYAALPAIERDAWEEEAFNRLDRFLIRYHKQQRQHLHYLLDDLERSADADPAAVRDLLRQRMAITRQWHEHLRRLRDRSTRRPASVLGRD